MQQGLTLKEAVRLAKETLGDLPSAELSAYIQDAFGMQIKPPIVTVLLGTLQEREALDRTGQAAREKIEQWKADNPEEAKKIAAAAKRRESAARRKMEAANLEDAAGESQQVPVPGTSLGGMLDKERT